jgi:hypothetical protein
MKAKNDISNSEVNLHSNAKEDFYTQLPSKVKQDIDKAKNELDRGEGIPHQQVMSEIRKRYLKK